MANMGKTGTIYITPEMMTSAIQAIKNYRESAAALHSEVETTVSTLTAGDFVGEASTGFMAFYTERINPATGKSLNDLLDTLEQICKSIHDAIPGAEGVDIQLGTANKQ